MMRRLGGASLRSWSRHHVLQQGADVARPALNQPVRHLSGKDKPRNASSQGAKTSIASGGLPPPKPYSPYPRAVPRAAPKPPPKAVTAPEYSQQVSTSELAGFANDYTPSAEEAVLLTQVDKLAQWKDEVANHPSPNAHGRVAIRSTLEKVLAAGDPDCRRFAALYVTKSALSMPPNGIQSPLAQVAINIVSKLAKEDDPEAMVLVGQWLEQTAIGPKMTENLFRATQYYEAAVDLVHLEQWTRVPDNQLIVTPADALCSLGTINFNSSVEVTAEKAMTALLSAVQDHNHFEACRFLEGQLDKYSADRYDCLLRLAVTGYYPAAKALGDIASAAPREFGEYDLAVREDLLGGKSWSKVAARLRTRDMQFDMEKALDASPKKMPLAYNAGTAWINPHASWPLPANVPIRMSDPGIERTAHWLRQCFPSGGGPSIAVARSWASESQDQASYMTDVASTFTDTGCEQGHTDVHNTAHRLRYFKALDWYLFAAIGGHVPAMIAGCKWAAECLLGYYVLLFKWHIDQLPQAVRDRHDTQMIELLKDKRLVDFLEDITKTQDIKRVMIYDHIPTLDAREQAEEIRKWVKQRTNSFAAR